MATITAMQPKPYVFNRPVVEIELVQATINDIRLFDPVSEKYIRRLNLIYWLKSSITGLISGTPYIISEETSPIQIKEWLDLNMMYIAKSPFN